MLLILVQNLPTLLTDFVPSGPLPRVCTAVFSAPPWWFADATATPLAALFRIVRGTVAYLGPIGMCLSACGPGKRLIVDRYLPSHITHFFVFSTRRSNSGCGAGEHKHQHQRRPQSRTLRFDGHTSWFSGWPEPNGQRELQWWAQKLVSESAISRAKFETCATKTIHCSSGQHRTEEPRLKRVLQMQSSRCMASARRRCDCGWSKEAR